MLIDLEAGDLPVANLPVASIRPRTWADLRDLAVAIGGPDPARASGSPYSQEHYDKVIVDSTLASLAQYSIVFVDSYTELARRCRTWCEQQPEASNAYGKKDLRGVYGMVGRELIGWTQQLQHARARTVILVTILEKIVDDRGVPSWQVQLEGQRARRELPAILDVIVTMTMVTFKDGKARRAFVCDPANSWGYPAKDRSGRLDPIEEAELGETAEQTFNPANLRRTETMPIDLSKTSTPRDFGALIPAGAIAPMQIYIKPGGHGEGGLLTPAETEKGRSAYLHLEFNITAGPHKDRKIWTRSTVEGDNHAAAIQITSDFLGSLARSAFNFSMKDESPEVVTKLQNFDLQTLDGLRVIGKVGVERGKLDGSGSGDRWPDKNTLVTGVTKDMTKEWGPWGPVVQDLDDGLPKTMTTPASQGSPSSIEPPPWGEKA